MEKEEKKRALPYVHKRYMCDVECSEAEANDCLISIHSRQKYAYECIEKNV